MHGLRRFNVRVVHEAIAATGDFAPFPRSEDRAAVKALLAGVDAGAMAGLRRQAGEDAIAPIPPLPAELYLDFQRTGRREPYEDAQRQRRNMLYRLVLAEYGEGRGAFIQAIANLLWARLEETNWAWPAHARTLDFPDRPTLDLAAAMTALDLAEIDHLVGAHLPPELRARIRSEVERRAIGPFLTRHDHWWLHTTPERPVNNWTAVCVAGVVGAACYLEADTGRLAEIAARGILALADYLETFDPRGGSTEGPDYWAYGFGNFVVLAQLLAVRTGGRIDLLGEPFVREIAQFPLRTILAPGVWVSFSDSDHNPSFHPGLLSHLARTLGLDELLQLGMRNDFAVEQFNQFAWPLRQYAWPLPAPAARFTGAAHDWFPDMGWMISRLDPQDAGSLRAAIKGGHNDEMHNQNDVGSLIVVSGGPAVITDPGRGRYSKAYFGPERYGLLMASSLGHSVPVVNGYAQSPGRQHAAQVIEHRHDSAGDRLVLEMSAAYPAEADLTALQRELVFDRQVPGGEVRLTDSFTFGAAPGSFESVLVTTGSAEIDTGTVRLRVGEGALEVEFDPAGVMVRLDRHAGVEKQYAPSINLTRVVFGIVEPARSGSIALVIRPGRWGASHPVVR